jgi:hypothetical protein
MEVHPLANIFPMLSEDELNDLAADIKENGLLHPIVRMTDGKTIVDGRNRYEACRRAEVEPHFEDSIEDDDQARALIISANIQRRNMTKDQQAMAHAVLNPEPEKAGRRKNGCATQPLEFDKSRLSRARAILRHSEAMMQSVLSGGLSIDAALAQMKKRAEDDAKPEARIAALRVRYTDLAVKVTESELSIEAAEVEANMRDQREAERREVMLRVAEAALYNIAAFAAPGFVDDVAARLDEADFHQAMVNRLRLDPKAINEQIDRVKAGASELVLLLRALWGDQ